MSKIIAITGSTGFVGRAVVERLLESEDVQLRCLVREGSDTEHLKSLGARVTLVRGDVMEPGTLPLLVDGAWGVINLAGKREFWSPRVQDFYDLNEHAAENVFRAALDAHCEKVIQVSTPLAFGMPEQRPFDETSAPSPTDPRSRSANSMATTNSGDSEASGATHCTNKNSSML